MRTIHYWQDGRWCEEWELPLMSANNSKVPTYSTIRVSKLESDAGVDALVRCNLNGWKTTRDICNPLGIRCCQ